MQEGCLYVFNVFTGKLDLLCAFTYIYLFSPSCSLLIVFFLFDFRNHTTIQPSAQRHDLLLLKNVTFLVGIMSLQYRMDGNLVYSPAILPSEPVWRLKYACRANAIVFLEYKMECMY